jgi:UDP-glucose 4-epimerase
MRAVGYEPVRAIVTGGAGFVGSHVVDALLARGDEVHVVDDLSTGRRGNVAHGAVLYVEDVRDDLAPLFDRVRPDLCFHLAAQASVSVSVAEPVRDAAVNVLGTLRVLEAANRHGTRVVFSSSGGAIYGECEAPAAEDAPTRPLSPYGTSKLCAEEYLLTYGRLHGTAHSAVRYANVYGPRQDPHGEAGVVALFFGRLLAGRPPEIFGDGGHVRDYVYVGDAATATLAAGDGPAGTYNVGTGIGTTTLQLAGRCVAVAGVDFEPEFAPPRAGDLRRSVVDASRAGRELGWRPEHPLDDGLALTWEAMRKEAGTAGRI